MNEERSTEVSDVFDALRSIPADMWRDGETEEIQNALQESGALDFDDDLEAEMDGTLRVLGRVAHEYDERTFVDAVETGELPPLELSEREMEFVRGGSDSDDLIDRAVDWLQDQLTHDGHAI